MRTVTTRMNNPIEISEYPQTTETATRIIGRIDGPESGPAIIVFAGMHGNEPAGINALEQFFEQIQHTEPHFHGKIVGIRGNLSALAEGVRFMDEDLNRIWFPSIIDKIKRSAFEELESSERVEIKELLQLIRREIPEEQDQPVIFVDLHSFSAQGDMFAITARKDRNMELISSMHIPMIFGIEEALRGTALRYFQDLGYITMAVEGGNHQNKLTITNNTAALILLVARAGCLDPAEIPDFEEFNHHLKQQNYHLPTKVELVYQHIIEEGDRFKMQPGFSNFQPIKKGEWLASDRNGQIRAQCDGFLLMPLYQKQGDDGFFIVREQA